MVPQRCWEPGREGGRKPALGNITAEPGHVGELIVGYRGAHFASDRQEQRDILGREPVIAALCKEEAVSWMSAESNLANRWLTSVRK